MGVIENERYCLPRHEGRKPLELVADTIITESNQEIAIIDIKRNDLFEGKLRFDWIVDTKVKIGEFEYRVSKYEEDPLYPGIVKLYLQGKYKEGEPVKYYYPSSNEISVGYEGEINWIVGYEHSFQNIIIDQEHLMSDDFWESSTQLRCPLLSREQIEKEGWILSLNGDYAEVYDLNEFQLDRNVNTHIIEIFKGSGFTLYKGQCPTINHLRTIMRLLNIK